MIEKYEHANMAIYVIADTHGNFDILKSNIYRYKNIHNCILIIAGDIGLGFYSKKYYDYIFEELNNLFIERSIYCYLLRGNHDDPNYFKNHLINYSNVKTIDDYSVISVGNENILCVGGAISIDRRNRIESYNKKLSVYEDLSKQYSNAIDFSNIKPIYKSYWEDEIPYYDESKLNEIIENGLNIDYIISHTSPSFCFKSGVESIQYWINNDESLLSDLRHERSELDKVLEKIRNAQNGLKKWVYGHFHEHYHMENENVQYIALCNCDYSFDCYLLNSESLEL